MADSRVQLNKSPLQMRQRSECSFCHNMLDPNALFCDTCGTPHDISQVYQVRSEMQQNVDTLNVTLQSLESRKAALMKEIEVLEGKRGALSDTLQQLTIENESIRSKQREFASELQSLTTQLRQSEVARKSEEATIGLLSRGRLERRVKLGARKKGRPHETLRRRKPHGVKQDTHTFVGKYEGKGDWNAELAKRIAQFELSLDHTTYAVSPGKIVFNVTGSREDIEKMAAALNELEGFVNLRSRFAETRRNLRETINARKACQDQLDTLDKAPWFKRATTRGLASQKAELSQQMVTDDLKIKTLNESLRALERLLGVSAYTT